MSLQEIVFIVLSIFTLGCAAGVILSRNPINSVLFLILTFFTISAHYLMLNAQFLAIVNIIVYAGAIMVLFLFVIMLMNLNSDTEPQKSILIQFPGVLSGGALSLVIIAAFKSSVLEVKSTTIELSNIGLIEVLGKKLFTEFVFAFEISSLLFLSGMIGAVMLGKKDDAMMTIEE